MSTAQLKSELNQIINSINDSKTLKAIHTLLTVGKENKADWWDTISEEEKRLIQTGIKQLKEGKGIPHNEVRKKVDAMLYKR